VHHLEEDPPGVPVIEHFQDVFKNRARRRERDELYEKLAKQAGVHVVGGKPLEEDVPVDDA